MSNEVGTIITTGSTLMSLPVGTILVDPTNDDTYRILGKPNNKTLAGYEKDSVEPFMNGEWLYLQDDNAASSLYTLRIVHIPLT
jgi:hypothetical protein